MERLPLNSLDNIRDLGSIQTRDGYHILPGRLLRGGDLYHASYDDQNDLRRIYRLTMIIDLRTDREREERPDASIYGAEYVSVPVMEKKPALFWGRDRIEALIHFHGDGGAYMYQLYEDLVLGRRDQHAYGEFLRLLKHHGEGAVLWHSMAGKDRAGVGTALLLEILGVPRETILEDYMYSGICLHDDIQAVLRILEERRVPRRVLTNAKDILGVKGAYLEHAFEKILERYGTFDKYMKKALGLSAFDKNFLRDRYLRKNPG